MSARKNKKNVLFLGTHGQFNIGDELLLTTFLDQLGADNHYAVNSYAPDATAAFLADRFDVTVFSTTEDKRAVLRQLRRCDIVVFGGGSIIKELYESTGRWRYSTLVMVLAIVTAARLLRRPVIMSNIGVGPITTDTGRRLAGQILRLVHLVSVRDSGSLATAHQVRCDPNRVIQVPDAVFANSCDAFGPSAVSEPRTDGVTRIALNMNKDIANPDAWEPFCDNLHGALRQLAANGPIEIHALPMQCHFKADTDLEVLEVFLARLADIPVVIHEPADQNDVARIISECDVVVSERLHALVIAAILGRPSVALVYDVKVAELAAQLGIDDTAIDINEPFGAPELARSINQTLRESTDRATALQEIASDKRAELDSYFAFLYEVIRTGVVPKTWPTSVRPTPQRLRAHT